MNNFRKVVPVLLVVSAAAFEGYGQSDFVGVPGSTFLDNLADSARAKNQPENILATNAFSGINAFIQRDQEQSFLTMRRITATYTFAEIDSKLSDHATTINHGVTPDLYLEARNGLNLDTALVYQHSARDDNKPTNLDGNSYGLVVQPGYNLWRLIDADSKTDQLVLANALGYKRGEVTLHSGGISTDSDVDNYILGPSLSYVRSFNPELQGFLVASYTELWKESRASGASNVETRGGLFNFQARSDYHFNTRVTGSLFATWKHDVDQKVAPGTSATFRDWAEFGGSLRYVVSGNVLLKAGYSYEAFNSAYASHNVNAAVLVSF